MPLPVPTWISPAPGSAFDQFVVLEWTPAPAEVAAQPTPEGVAVDPVRFTVQVRTEGGEWASVATLQTAPRAGLYLGDLPAGPIELRVQAEEGGELSAWSELLPLEVLHVGETRPPPPGITPADEPRGVVQHWEIWSDLECAGGAQLAFLPDWIRAGDEWQIEERTVLGRLSLRLRAGSEGTALLAHERVIRAVMPGAHTEWRITAIEDGRGDEGETWVEVRCASPILDLGHGDPVQRREADGSVSLGFPLQGLTPEEHASAAVERAPLWWWLGTVESTERRDLQYTNVSTLRALQQLAEAAELEITAERSGADGYVLHLVQRVGAGADVPHLRYGKGNRAVRRGRISDPTVTRVYPVLPADDTGAPPTIAGAAWPIASVTHATGWVALGEQPIGFDQQFDSLYVQTTGGGPCIRVEETDAAEQRVRLVTTAGLAPGMELQFRADALGTELAFLDHPQAKSLLGVLVRGHERADIPDTQNLLGAGSFFDRFTAPGIADGWEAVGVVSAAEDRGGATRHHGGASWRVVMESGEAEVRSAWRPIRPTAAPAGRFLSAQLHAFQLRGAVRLELEVEDRTGAVHVFPRPDSDELAYSTVVNGWIDNLAVAGIDVYELGSVRARLRIRNHAAQRTEVWLDAAMLTPSADGSASWYPGRAANDLWKSGQRFLREKGGIEASYEVGLVDFERLYPETFDTDRLVLGGDVQVYDEELGLDVAVRCLRVQRDLAAGALSTVELATRVETLEESLVVIAPVVPQRPADPAAQRPVPRVVFAEVELEAEAAVVTVRGNAHARSLWHEELVGGAWGSRTRFSRAAAGAFRVARGATAARVYRVAASDEADLLGPWRGPLRVDPLPVVVEVPPEWDYTWVMSATLGKSDVFGAVRDAFGGGGTLYVWTTDDPTGPPAGSVHLVGTNPSFGPDTVFTLAGGGTAKLLNDVAYDAAVPRDVHLKYESDSGLSTTVRAVPLKNRLDKILDSLGDLKAGSIRSAAQFGEGVQPILAFTAVPGTYQGADTITVGDPANGVAPKLYHWSGTAYVRTTAPLEGTIQDGQVDPTSNLARTVQAKTQVPMHGGGDITWSVDGVLTFTQRLISIPNNLSAENFFNFGPLAGVTLAPWQALVFRAHVGAGGTHGNHPLDGTGAGWFVADYLTYAPTSLASGTTDFVIAVHSGDSGQLILFDGRILKKGQTIRESYFIPDLGVGNAHIRELHGEKIVAHSLTAEQLDVDSARVAVLTGTTAEFEFISGGFFDWTVARGRFAAIEEIESRTLTTLQAQIGTLAGLTDDLGVIVAGKLLGQLDSLNRRPEINLNATGTQYFFDTPNFKVRADGLALFTVGPDATFAPGYDPSAKETPAGAQQKVDAGRATVNVVRRSPSQPLERADYSALQVGDVWIDTGDGDAQYTWDGTVWVRSFTRINGGHVQLGLIDAQYLAINGAATFGPGYDPSTKETPGGAQQKADAAELSAKAYADSMIVNAAGNVAITSAAAPTMRPSGSPLQAGDQWYDSDDGYKPYVWVVGFGWQRNYTRISAGDLVTGFVDADRINAIHLSVLQATVTDLSAINGTFSGALNGATGTFSGALSAASGTFTGNLILRNGASQIQLQTSGGAGYGHVGAWTSAFGSGINFYVTNEDVLVLYDTGSGKAATCEGAWLFNDEARLAAGTWYSTDGVGGMVVRQGTGGRLDILSRTLFSGDVLAYYLGTDGRAYADLGWTTFSPTPPKPAAEMSAADWIGWAMEDAGKAVKPYAGIPTAEHPEVAKLARRDKGGQFTTHAERDRRAAAERDLYSKDVSKIAIGTARWGGRVQAALAQAQDFAHFKQLLGATP